MFLGEVVADWPSTFHADDNETVAELLAQAAQDPADAAGPGATDTPAAPEDRGTPEDPGSPEDPRPV